MDQVQFEKLSGRYSGALPRYTSYPTAVELRNDLDRPRISTEYQRIIAEQQPLSLYIHLPFCPSLCYFCACNKIITQDTARIDEYLEVLDRESALISSIAGAKPLIEEVHLGGGSPSYLSVQQIERLSRLLKERFDISKDAAMSIEIDPRTMTPDKAKAYRNLGMRRASLGVQDFDPAVQKAINREQSFELTKSALNTLRQLGYEGVNLDLVYGLPLQTSEGFNKTLALVSQLDPERVALYGYAHVTWKSKVQNVFHNYPLPSPHERLLLLNTAVTHFSNHGYRFIGLDHFAKADDDLSRALLDGRLRRNFMGYTVGHGQGVLALGVSSITDLGTLLVQNTPKIEDYIELLNSASLPHERCLWRSEEDRIRAYIIERILCQNSLNILEVEKIWGVRGIEIMREGIQKLSPHIEDGLVSVSQDSIFVSELGRYFLRTIAAVFDQYLPLHQSGSKPVFSQAV